MITWKHNVYAINSGVPITPPSFHPKILMVFELTCPFLLHKNEQGGHPYLVPCSLNTLVDIYLGTASFLENISAILTIFLKEFRTNDMSFESPTIELLESGKKLGVASS